MSSPYRDRTFLATFIVDGERWPFSGTAITHVETSEADERRLSSGAKKRVVLSPYSATRRAGKQTPIQVNFEKVTMEWYKRLSNLVDANRRFDVELLAFDSREDTGVPMYPLTGYITTTNSPTAPSVFATPSSAIPGGPRIYRIVAVVGSHYCRPSEPIHCNDVNVTLEWPLISGVTAYRVYGRLATDFKTTTHYLGNATIGSTTATFFDNNSITPTNDSLSPFTKFAVGNEKRWRDDPETIEIFVNGTSVAFDMIDRNGITIDSDSQTHVDSRNGTVTFVTPKSPFVDIRAKYRWMPSVFANDITPNPEPSQSIKYSGGTLYQVRYSPTVTLWTEE